jgi:hypothetical protein
VRKFWLLGALAAVALAWGAWTVAGLPLFRLSSLAITGLDRVPYADVAMRAAIDPRANVWFINRRAIEQRIDAIPYVATAAVHVRPPASVWIDVTERVPQACVRDGAGAAFLVDASLRVLETGCLHPELTYLVRSRLDARPGTFLNDPELRALVADAQSLAAGDDRYRAFAHDPFGQLEATLQDGILVRFGDDDDLDGKQRLIGPILAELGPRAGAVRAVDLRAPAAPVVEFGKTGGREGSGLVHRHQQPANTI